jgi:hypothetical protein
MIILRGSYIEDNIGEYLTLKSMFGWLTVLGHRYHITKESSRTGVLNTCPILAVGGVLKNREAEIKCSLSHFSASIVVSSGRQINCAIPNSELNKNH